MSHVIIDNNSILFIFINTYQQVNNKQISGNKLKQKIHTHIINILLSFKINYLIRPTQLKQNVCECYQSKI